MPCCIDDVYGESPPPRTFFQDTPTWPNVRDIFDTAIGPYVPPAVVWKPFGEHVGEEEEDETREKQQG
eukprot:1695328-Pyramimonas_sp.AAC.1